MDNRSENKARGILAPAKLEKPMNQMMCGRAGWRASMQPGNVSYCHEPEMGFLLDL